MASETERQAVLYFILAVFLFTTHQIAFGKRIPSFAGPFTIILKRFVNNLTDEDAGERKLWIHGYAQSYRPGHPQFFHGKQGNTVPLTDDYQALIRVDKRSNNQWKKNAFLMKFPNGCSDTLRYLPAIRKLAFAEDAMKCPLPAGERIITNRTVNIGMENIPVFPYGSWRVYFSFPDKNGQILGGFVCEADTIPKVN